MDDRRTAEIEERIAELEFRLRRGERQGAPETAFWALMHNIFPDETRRHMKAAGREQLLAARAYLDHWIGKMGERSAPEEATERETIEVE